MQRVRHYEHAVTVNVPLQIALARQALDWVVMGGVDGIIRVYDRATGGLVHQLEHQFGGRVQVVEVSGHWTGKRLVTYTTSDAEYTRDRVDCRRLIHSWQKVQNPALARKGLTENSTGLFLAIYVIIIRANGHFTADISARLREIFKVGSLDAPRWGRCHFY